MREQSRGKRQALRGNRQDNTPTQEAMRAETRGKRHGETVKSEETSAKMQETRTKTTHQHKKQ